MDASKYCMKALQVILFLIIYFLNAFNLVKCDENNKSGHLKNKSALTLPSDDEKCQKQTSSPEHFQIAKTPVLLFAQHWDICSIVFSPDSGYLASADTTGRVLLWDLKLHKQVWHRRMPVAGDVALEELDLAFSGDGTKLFVASDIQAASVWDSSNGSIRRSLYKSGSVVEDYSAALAIYHVAGIEVVVVRDGPNIVFLNALSNKIMGSIKDAGQDVLSLRISSNEKRIALGLRDGRAIVRELPSGKLLLNVRATRDDIPVNSVALDVSGTLLVAGSDDGIKCWNVNDNEYLWSAEQKCVARGSIAVSPDGKLLLTDSRGGQFVLRDIQDGTIISSVSHGSSDWSALAYNNDGTSIATGAEDGTVAVWNIEIKKR
jgi:WD40 repeat protein